MRGGVKVLVTGFGPFEGVEDNASRRVALAVAEASVALEVVAVALPTSYVGAREALEDALRVHRPDALVLLGVAPSEHVRVETRASGQVTSSRPDVDGATWEGRELGPARATPWPIEAWLPTWQEAAAEVGLRLASSSDCGGYVCNATYHAALGFDRPSLFVHLPQAVDEDAIAAKAHVVRAIVETVGAALGAPGTATQASPRGLPVAPATPAIVHEATS